METEEFRRSDPSGSAEQLRERMTEDGYLFFEGLLRPDDVLDVRREFLGALAEHAWLEDRSDPFEGRPGPLIRRSGDENWWNGYVAVQRLESFHRLAHSDSLTSVMAGLVGGELMTYPLKIARITYPGAEYPTHPHQDFYFVRGHSDVFTAWVPLGEVPPEMGGIHIAPGSHHEGLKAVRAARGAGDVTADIDPDAYMWHTTHYRPGDVICFHSLALHWAPDNKSNILRISADYRYQSCDDTCVTEALFPHDFGIRQVPPWRQLSGEWSSTKWIDPPDRVTLAKVRVDPNDVPESRYARVPEANEMQTA